MNYKVCSSCAEREIQRFKSIVSKVAWNFCFRSCLNCHVRRSSPTAITRPLHSPRDVDQLTAGGGGGRSWLPPWDVPGRSLSSSWLSSLWSSWLACTGPALILCRFRLGRITYNITAKSSIIVTVVNPPSPSSPPVAASRPPPGLLSEGTAERNIQFNLS